MATPTLAPGSQDYARAAAKAGLEALYAGAWVATGGLSIGKRRVARAAIVATTAAVGAVTERAEQDGSVDEMKSAAEKVTDSSKQLTEEDKRRLATKLALAATAGTVLSIGRRRLRNRWLNGLASAGHPHPHRALAVRMTALTFVVSLSRHVITAAESRRETSPSRS